MRYLLVEDDRETADYVSRGFREHGDVVDHAANGQDGLMMATDTRYDALIIDRMLPGIDGLKLLNMLRAGGNQTPAIFLTAIGGIEDRVEGLQVAEDYLVKPFAFAELHARVGVLVRSAAPSDAPQTTYSLAGLCLDRLKRTVERDGEVISLQPVEFRLLEYLMRHEGRVVTRTMLLENVWDFNFDPRTNIVETHISRLRSKVDKGFDRPLIHTVRGAGYRLSDDG
ncbi:winged helix-turn-helix domain-containing protein [Henriciella algicola]|uniref:DNA-binding response regulator n=1 Tax=Henriciella algicola TaxID=1608422 RepID=A0A399RD93_9PROT|nr:response regulator transcription factor [Henriciella algicola]RIJ27469.1 DNA-binding response regulator [Henriciella algicola]